MKRAKMPAVMPMLGLDGYMRVSGVATKYRKEYDKIAYELCAHHGFTIAQLAEVFDVSQASVIYRWLQQVPSFNTAVTDGRDFYDTHTVERTLIKAAIGYEYTETTEHMDANGDTISTVKHNKHQAPNVNAIRMWLYNRDAARYKDTKNLDVNGVVNHEHGITIDVSELDDKELGVVEKLLSKAVKTNATTARATALPPAFVNNGDDADTIEC